MSRAGVNLVGYLNHVIGLGESARQFQGALLAAGIPHALAALDLGEHAPRLPEARAPWLAEAELPFDVTVLWCNPDRHGIDVDPAALPGNWLVGRWAWELPELPDEWRAAASTYNEIWTASSFVRNAVQAAVPIPVRVIPMAFNVLPAAPLDRRSWDLPPDRPLFAFMFDHHSIAARKNPLGLIAAFAEAFPDEREATLLIKTINAAAMPKDATLLEEAASEHAAIRLLDISLPGPERLTLLAGCDCYVSLHRSEGFGMTIAEAMAYARPVIATDFGGSVDLLDASTGYPVRWRAASVGSDTPVYPADGVWAEPDLPHAVSLMREVLEHPADAMARGSCAASRIASAHSPIAVGRAVEAELRRLTESF